jgi:hypothetical protein
LVLHDRVLGVILIGGAYPYTSLTCTNLKMYSRTKKIADAKNLLVAAKTERWVIEKACPALLDKGS